MIQRIQTVFLLLVLISLGLFLWMPLIQLSALPHNLDIKGWEVTHKYNGWIYYINSILAGTALGLTLISIFLFKKRDLQMLICWFSVVFIGAAVAVVYYEYRIYIWPNTYGLPRADVIFTPWNALAGVAILFQILAWYNIRKDENTIKSLDRLR
jgi:hypothetical protein